MYLSGARTRAGSLSPVDVPRRSRGPREPVHSVIGRDATGTGTHTQGKRLTAMDVKFNNHHFVKPSPASLRTFIWQRGARRAVHKAESRTAVKGAISRFFFQSKTPNYDYISVSLWGRWGD